MQSSHRSLLVATAGLLLVAGCCNSRAPQASADAAVAIARRPVITRSFPSDALRAEMRKLHVYTEELRRRAPRDMIGNAPAVVVNIIKAMPSYGAPKEFFSGIDKLRKRAEALKHSKALTADYGRLVESCVSCHEQLAQQLVGHVARLRLPAPDAAVR